MNTEIDRAWISYNVLRYFKSTDTINFCIITEDLLLQEDLIHILPMVNEANAMSEELDKKVKFEVALIAPQARGLKEGRTEVNVKHKNLETGTTFMWDRNTFIDRKFMMQEMYQNYVEGDPNWNEGHKTVSSRFYADHSSCRPIATDI